jgi:hypothetical protein
VAPLFLLIVLATADIVRVFRAQIRMEMIAVQIGQIVSQCARITTPGDVDEFWGHAARIAGGLVDVNSATGGAMIISAVSRNGNANRLDWQIRTGNVSVQSTFAPVTVGGAPTISARNAAAFVVPAGQTLLVTEVYAVVIPWALSAGLIGTVLPQGIAGLTMFLSRASEPSTLQQPPVTPVAPDPPRDCTA